METTKKMAGWRVHCGKVHPSPAVHTPDIIIMGVLAKMLTHMTQEQQTGQRDQEQG